MEISHANANDAQLTLQLYELRREAELRKARNWMGGEFWPRSFSELEQTMMSFQTPENHWLRQVISYWDMAAALVVRGTLHPGLFYDTCGEAWFCYAKMKPFIAEARQKLSPEFMVNLEKAVEGTPEGRERLQRTLENVARFGAMMQESKRTGQVASEAA